MESKKYRRRMESHILVTESQVVGVLEHHRAQIQNLNLNKQTPFQAKNNSRVQTRRALLHHRHRH